MDDFLSFSSLLRHAQERAQKPPSAATPNAELARVFQAALPRCQVVSFDVFDTLLVRYVHDPRDVFLHLERTEPFARRRWPAPVWQLRLQAENRARQQLHRATGSGEANLSEIYAAFRAIAQCDLPQAQLVRAEEEIELKLCRPCPAIAELYQMARAAGKRIIFVSDTYHHARFLCELLSRHEFPASAESLFASSEFRLNKQSSGLFPDVLRQIGTHPSAVLHVGDHRVSDFEQPRKLGMQAILHQHNAAAGPRKVFAAATAPLQSVLCGLAAVECRAHQPARDFWWLLGYNVFGPLFAGFCLWLERSFRNDGVSRAWFLLRDGEIFERVYRALFPGELAVPIGTLPSSRRAFLLPVLETAPNLAWSALLAGIEPRPIREYLERLQVPAEPFTAEFETCGFSSLDEIIDGRLESERLLRLVRQPRVQAALIQQSRLERESLLAFLEQEGLLSNQKIALIDLGWRGSIQKAVHLLLAELNPGLIGYYLGTTTGFASGAVPGLTARGFLMHEGKPEPMAERIAQFPQLLEIVCSNASGSLLHFQRRQGRVEGVFQEPDVSAEQHRQIAAIHDGAVAFAHAFAKINAGLRLGGEIPPAIAAEALFRLIANPTKEEATRLGGLTLSDNAGSTTLRACARFRQATGVDPLLADYRRAFWKAGLISQPTPQAATLRTLLWLMQE